MKLLQVQGGNTSHKIFTCRKDEDDFPSSHADRKNFYCSIILKLYLCESLTVEPETLHVIVTI